MSDLREDYPDAYQAGQTAKAHGMRRVPPTSYQGEPFHAWIAGYDADPMSLDADSGDAGLE